jgi:hypothetical protein
MIGWIITAAVVAVVAALVWWSSGRARPFGNRRDVYDDVQATEARAASRGRPGGGPLG